MIVICRSIKFWNILWSTQLNESTAKFKEILLGKMSNRIKIIRFELIDEMNEDEVFIIVTFQENSVIFSAYAHKHLFILRLKACEVALYYSILIQISENIFFVRFALNGIEIEMC
ncbi:hypothetical protein BLOT_003505, partial [Blomia tropicalis]